MFSGVALADYVGELRSSIEVQTPDATPYPLLATLTRQLPHWE
jgi:hypothetical protein